MAHDQLAQVNIGRVRAPLDDPLMDGFRTQLDPINALADRSPGFVWRLQTEDGNATAIHAFDDDLLLVNMSVWESIDALSDFVYRSAHVNVMKRRREWFETMDEQFLVLWWVPAGTQPDLNEAKRRLELLRANGPTPDAFTFRQSFAPGAAADAAADIDDRWSCPTA